MPLARYPIRTMTRIALANLRFPSSPDDSIALALAAIIHPDGTVLTWQPYGVEGLLLADLDLTAATGLYARRYRPQALNS